ncbi:hypothetical protein U9M48_005125, partial [Paspalum notatum var. saurae]
MDTENPDVSLRVDELATNYIETGETFDRKATIVDTYFSKQVADTLSDPDPKSVVECRKRSDWNQWKEAIEKEIASLYKREVFSEVMLTTKVLSSSERARRPCPSTAPGVGKAKGKNLSPGPSPAAGGHVRLRNEHPWQLREQFQRFDLDGDGSLTKLELAALLRLLGLCPLQTPPGTRSTRSSPPWTPMAMERWSWVNWRPPSRRFSSGPAAPPLPSTRRSSPRPSVPLTTMTTDSSPPPPPTSERIARQRAK